MFWGFSKCQQINQCSRLEQRSVIKFLVVAVCKPCEECVSVQRSMFYLFIHFFVKKMFQVGLILVYHSKAESKSVMVPTLQTIMNSSYYYEYRENIHLSVKLTPAKHFGSQTDIQHSFTYAVFILSFSILISHNLEFVSFFRTFYWSTTKRQCRKYKIHWLSGKEKVPGTMVSKDNAWLSSKTWEEPSLLISLK